jgi:hypothetical protein
MTSFNAISQYDATRTPLQFVYEAADCRIWYQPNHLHDIRSLWTTVANTAFGLGGVQQYAYCVNGSTNHPSSLSGDPGLYNNGQIANVTGYVPQAVPQYDLPLQVPTATVSGAPTSATPTTIQSGKPKKWRASS